MPLLSNTTRKTIAELVATVSGVSAIWVEERNPQVGASGRPGGEAWIELAFLADEGGDSEYRSSANPDNPNAIDNLIVVYKIVTISLRAKSFDASVQPADLLATTRAKITGSVTAQTVYAEGKIAFVETHPIAGIRGMTVNNRTRLEATMDVRWAALDIVTADDDPGFTLGSASPIVLEGQE